MNRPWQRALTLGGALSGGLGWWLPWVLHPSGVAALVLLGLDLGEFFKFTSFARPPLNDLYWEMQSFFLPPVVAALALAAWGAPHGWRTRLSLWPLTLFLALVILPPYPYSSAQLLSAEFRAQTILALLGLGGSTLLLARRWERGSGLSAVMVALGVVGVVVPLWAMWRVWPLLGSLYGTAPLLGVGGG